MSEWPLIRTIIGREYRAWRKPFLISSIVILAVVGTAIGIAAVAARNP